MSVGAVTILGMKLTRLHRTITLRLLEMVGARKKIDPVNYSAMNDGWKHKPERSTQMEEWRSQELFEPFPNILCD